MNFAPEIIYLSGGLISGLIIGIITTFLITRQSRQNIPENVNVEFEIERSRLQTELSNSEKRITELRGLANNQEVQINQLTNQAYELNADKKALEAKLASEIENNKERFSALDEEHRRLADSFAALSKQASELNADKKALEIRLQNEIENSKEKLSIINEAQQKLTNTFTALSKEALDQNNVSFINQAQEVLKRFQEGAQTDLWRRQEQISEIVAPVKESLDKVDLRIKEIEQARTNAYSALNEQISHMANSHQKLNDAATHLVSVLRNNRSRGQWGEIQLRRVVELAGMSQHCDFREQVSVSTEEGRLQPDMIVNLPSNRTIVVDAKAPMNAFWEANETSDEELKRQYITRHAQSLRHHVGQLSKKAYWDSFKPSPQFVVLFLPNEAIYSVALEHDSNLIEDAAMSNVIIATPTTLIALLKATAYGWRQESITKEAQQVGELGRQLYKRLSTMTEHILKLGDALNRSVQNYNKMIGSIERQVLPSARKFKELNIIGEGTDEIPDMKDVEVVTRSLQAAEIQTTADESVFLTEDYSVVFNIIREAIEQKKVLHFSYDNLTRMVEPHIFGRKTSGKDAFSGWLVGGHTDSDHEPYWRSYSLEKMELVIMLDETFTGARVGYNPEDKTMEEIYCRL